MKQSNRLLICSVITLTMAGLPLAAMAKGMSSNSSHKKYPSMTQSDCMSLPSNKSSYSSSEYKSRMDYCDSKYGASMSGSSTTEASPSAGGNTNSSTDTGSSSSSSGSSY